MCVIISLSPIWEAVRGLAWVICTVPVASFHCQASGDTSAPGAVRRSRSWAELLCPLAVQRTCISVSRCLAFLLDLGSVRAQELLTPAQ